MEIMSLASQAKERHWCEMKKNEKLNNSFTRNQIIVLCTHRFYKNI
jgi:hypothetical protein